MTLFSRPISGAAACRCCREGFPQQPSASAITATPAVAAAGLSVSSASSRGHRRTVRNYERLPAHHETYVCWAMIIVMTRRLARQPQHTQPQAADSPGLPRRPGGSPGAGAGSPAVLLRCLEALACRLVQVMSSLGLSQGAGHRA